MRPPPIHRFPRPIRRLPAHRWQRRPPQGGLGHRRRTRRVRSSAPRRRRSSHAASAPDGRRGRHWPSTASGWSRTSQPWQNGQWNTDRPHSAARPGDLRRPVLHARRQQHASRPFATPSAELEDEPVVVAHAADDASPVRTSTLGYAASSARPISYSSAGGRPSCPSRPPIPCAARLLWFPSSTTSVRRRARPSTKRGTQPRRAAADDDAIPFDVHATELAAQECDLPSLFAMQANATPRTTSTCGFAADCGICAPSVA